MPFILDASVAVAWAMPDEDGRIAEAAETRAMRDSPCAPASWWYELLNVLAINERRGRIASSEIEMFLESIVSVVELEFLRENVELLRLARKHKLSVYDAAYLEMALRKGAPLATLDVALKKAARAENVELVG